MKYFSNYCNLLELRYIYIILFFPITVPILGYLCDILGEKLVTYKVGEKEKFLN